VASKVVIE